MSAALLGCYDSFKKQALKSNAVIPVLFLNTLFSSLVFLPFIIVSANTTWLDGSILHVAEGGWEVHRYVVLKALIVLSSWVLGYFGMKHLPLTIVGPINATRPVMVLVGALLVVATGDLHRVAGVADVLELDALDHAAGAHVEARHDGKSLLHDWDLLMIKVVFYFAGSLACFR